MLRSSSSHPPEFEHPSLTPSFCFSTKTLKAFLRASRSIIDDTISQNLNALNTPATQKFDPASTSQIQRGSHSALLPSAACTDFVENVLMESWQVRSDVLNYCASVATSDDPDDPDSLSRMAEAQADRERVVDERLDPYSGRFFPRESRTETLAGIVRNERMVENITRERSWKTVKERCHGLEGFGESWEEAINSWRERKQGKR